MKDADFPYVRGLGANHGMKNSICFLHLLFKSFPEAAPSYVGKNITYFYVLIQIWRQKISVHRLL